MATEKLETILIGKKRYVTVNTRLKAFRSDARFEGFTLVTKVHELTPDACTMEAQIFDKNDRMVANGFAHEVRNAKESMVNSTSYVENCETSAWGRALGNLGIGVDESICSAQELLYALQAQEQTKPQQAPKPQTPVNPTAQPKEAPKSQENGQQSASITLSAEEQDEYDGLCADMDAAGSRADLEAIYNNNKTKRYAVKLGEHAAAICTRKGWSKK